MTTRELLYIKTIADEKSMTRAAQKLFVTQPSLSHCVTNIEEQLGVRLFTRTSSGLLLTYAGEKYYRMACEVLRVYASFESEISEERTLSQGRVTVGITNYLATAHLPRVLPAFHKEHPGIEVRICEETTDQVKRSLLSGKLDFAIMHTGPDDGVSDNPALVRDVLTEYAPLFEKRRLTADIADGVRIRGDETLLRRAVGCLLENAAKYSPENGRADEQPQSSADRRERL